MSLYSWDTNTSEMRVRRLERGQAYLRRGSYIASSSGVRKYVPSEVLTDDGRQLDLTQGGVKTYGSIPPSSNNPDFAVTTTDTTAVIYFDGTNGSKQIAVFRADGSISHVPLGRVTITGLTASTTYNLLPFLTPNNVCTIGWVQGTAGSPQICIVGSPTQYQLQQQNLSDREPLSQGALTIKTTAGAPSTGSIGSGGDPIAAPKNCVMLGTDIEGLDGIQFETKHFPWTDWWHLETEKGRTLYCTPDHPLYTWDGRRIEAKDVALNELMCTRDGDERVTMSGPHKRVCTKVAVSMPKLHLFYANGFLSHNVKMSGL